MNASGCENSFARLVFCPVWVYWRISIEKTHKSVTSYILPRCDSNPNPNLTSRLHCTLTTLRWDTVIAYIKLNNVQYNWESITVRTCCCLVCEVHCQIQEHRLYQSNTCKRDLKKGKFLRFTGLVIVMTCTSELQLA